jgi:hypothetical protein
MAGSMVDRATSDMLIGPNWAKNMEICDICNRNPGYCSWPLPLSLPPILVAGITNPLGTWVGEEGEGEIDELHEGAAGRRGPVQRLGMVERARVAEDRGAGFKGEETDDGPEGPAATG